MKSLKLVEVLKKEFNLTTQKEFSSILRAIRRFEINRCPTLLTNDIKVATRGYFKRENLPLFMHTYVTEIYKDIKEKHYA